MNEWFALVAPLTPVLTAMIGGVIALRWGDAERKALQEQLRSKDATIEVLKANDVKLVNDRYMVVRQSLQAMQAELQAQVDELKRENAGVDELKRENAGLNSAAAELAVKVRQLDHNWTRQVHEIGLANLRSGRRLAATGTTPLHGKL